MPSLPPRCLWIPGMLGLAWLCLDSLPGPSASAPPSTPSAAAPSIRQTADSLPARRERSRPVAAIAMPAPLAEPQTRPPVATALDQLPPGEQVSFQAALQEARYAAWPVADSPAASSRDREVSHFAANPRQDLTARYLKNGGVRFESGIPGSSWQGTLRWAGASAAGSGSGGDAGSWQATGVRAEFQRAGVTEWYANRSTGFEHGFTLQARPAEARSEGPLTLPIILDGLRAERDPDPAQAGNLVFTDPATGQPVLSYRDLKVWDADGQQLAADLRPTAAGFLVAVNDQGAKYPLTIDPLIASFQQRLDAGGAGSAPNSIAIDGDTLVAGAFARAYVFTRQAGQWSRQAMLTEPDGGERFGIAVAISGDTIVVGAPSQLRQGVQDVGAAYVYSRSGGSWSKTRIITAEDPEPGAPPQARRMGWSVAIRQGVIAVGAPGFGTFPGRVYLSHAWGISEQFVEMPSPPIGAAQLRFGISVALDESGNLLAVGACVPDFYAGAGGREGVYLYDGSAFSPIRFSLSDTPTAHQFGRSVTVSGRTVVVGAPRYNSPLQSAPGALFMYAPAGSGSWGETARILNQSSPAFSGIGFSVALEGNTLITGSSAGGAEIFTRSPSPAGGWSAPVQLTAAAPGQQASVGISGGTVAIGTLPQSGSTGGIAFFTGSGSSWSLQQRIDAGDGAADDNLGLHLALDGEVAVVGALNDDTAAGPNAGSAYVFRRSGTAWQREAKLTDPQGAANDRFGVAVGISGDSIVAGSDYDDESGGTDNGSASVFVRGGDGSWTRQGAKLVPVTGAGPPSHAGRAVAIDGDTVVIGIPDINTSAGLVSTYRRTGATWQPRGTTGGSLPQSSATFGFSLALHGDRLIVGAPLQNVTTLSGIRSDAGRVDIFTRTSATAAWTAQRGYISPSPETGGRFGFAVSLADAAAVIGEPGNPPGWTGGVNHATSQGRAWAGSFDNGSATWSSLSPIAAPAPASQQYFGFATAVQGDRALVSAIGWQGSLGAVYLYRKSAGAWTFQYQLPVSPMNPGDWFGCAVALEGDTAVAGGYGFDTEAGAHAGAARVYRLFDPAADPSPLQIAAPNGPGGDFVLTWPAGTGWSLYRSSSLTGDSWLPVPVTTDGSYSYPSSSAGRMYFRLSSP